MKKKEQILTLIESDIINYKLVRSLNDCGLDASDYIIDMTDVILDLVGTPEDNRTELLYETYFNKLRKATNFELKRSKNEAKKIYRYLNQF